MSTIYGDVRKPKSNSDCCTNLSVCLLGQMMSDLLKSWSSLASFSMAKLRIKKCSSFGFDLLFLSFWYLNAKRKPKIVRREKMKAFIDGFLGFESKEG